MSGVNYHAWTHRPKELGGTDPLEVATASPSVFRAQQYLFGTNQLVPDDNQQTVLWDHWEFEDEDVFAEQDFSGDYLTSIKVRAPGLYLVNYTVSWTTTSAWTTTLIINTPYRNYVTSYGFTGNAFDDYYGGATLIDLWPFDPGANFFDPDSPPAMNEIAFTVNQNSGINRLINRADVLVARIGDMDVATPTYDIGSPWAVGRVINGGV